MATRSRTTETRGNGRRTARVDRLAPFRAGSQPGARAASGNGKRAHVADRLQTPTDLGASARRAITAALNPLLADVLALYVKTKSFHWHMSGSHFRDHHLLLDEQAEQLFAMTDEIAERVRKVGGLTLHSVGEISRLTRVRDADADLVDPFAMLAQLRDDNLGLTTALRSAHRVCDAHGDVATVSLLEVWIDEAERRTWFLFETVGSSAEEARH